MVDRYIKDGKVGVLISEGDRSVTLEEAIQWMKKNPEVNIARNNNNGDLCLITKDGYLTDFNGYIKSFKISLLEDKWYIQGD